MENQQFYHSIYLFTHYWQTIRWFSGSVWHHLNLVIHNKVQNLQRKPQCWGRPLGCGLCSRRFSCRTCPVGHPSPPSLSRRPPVNQAREVSTKRHRYCSSDKLILQQQPSQQKIPRTLTDWIILTHLSEQSPIKSNCVGTGSTPHVHIEIHQQSLLFLTVDCHWNPLQCTGQHSRTERVVKSVF